MQKYCRQCDRELDSVLPYQCKYCHDFFCEEHRLPENHNCKNLKTSWDSWKKRQRKLQGVPEKRNTSHQTNSSGSPRPPTNLVTVCEMCPPTNLSYFDSLKIRECKYCHKKFCRAHIKPKKHSCNRVDSYQPGQLPLFFMLLSCRIPN